MKRRAFLASLAAACAAPALSWADAGSPAYLAAARAADGAYALYGLSAAGAPLFAQPLPARGHAATAHPTRPEAVAFARRPGTYALVIDCARGQTVARLTPPAGRQFNGHGTFSEDGATLFTSEVVAEGSAGRIGVWDAARGYRRVAEFASNGIGPHEIRRLPGTEILVVANGGIQTDPSDRTPLNLEEMRPNLSYLSASGAVLEAVELPEIWQNSIRHLALGADGLVAFAMQWQGDLSEPVPLLGLHRRGAAPRLCAAPDTEAGAMRGYAGSIALDPGQLKAHPLRIGLSMQAQVNLHDRSGPVLAEPGGHWHDYGKEPRAGRKVGHATVRADNALELAAALERIGQALGRQDQVAPPITVLHAL